MNRRYIIFGSIAVFVLLVLLWRWCRFVPDSASLPVNTKVNPPVYSSAAIPPHQVKPSEQADVIQNAIYPWQNNTYMQMPADRKPGYDSLLPQWKEWRRRNKADRNFEWKMPINFYGKAIDQNNQPVQRARVRFQWTDLSLNGTTEKFTESNDEGLFILKGESGKNLGVWVTKDGYHSEDGLGGKTFEYAAFFDGNYYEPDPKTPIIFRLIKKLEAEPLVTGNVYYNLSYELGAYYYDLERGKMSRQPPKGAGLKFNLARTASAQGQPFDWTWTVEGVNASVQATEDKFPQMAPNTGYTSQWQTSQSATADRFQQNGNVRLYIRTNEDRYGVVNLELAQPNLRDVGPDIGVKSFYNPSGSRNLEYDPAKKFP